MIAAVAGVTLFEVSYGAMWVLLVINSVLVLLLYRHFGLMSLETIEGVQRDGLAIGEEAPPIQGVSGNGEALMLHPGERRPAFVLFAAPECEPCKKVAPYVNRLAGLNSDGNELDVVVVAAGDGAIAAHIGEDFTDAFTLADAGSGVFETYRVRVTPFAFVVGDDRRIRAKGLCGDDGRLSELFRSAGLPRVADPVERAADSNGATERRVSAVFQPEEKIQ